MSNSLWSNLLHQRFLPSSVLEYRSRIGSPSYLGGSSLFQSQVNSQKRKPPLLTELCTDRFTLQKKKFPMAHQPSVSGSIQAKLATNPSSEVNFKMNNYSPYWPMKVIMLCVHCF